MTGTVQYDGWFAYKIFEDFLNIESNTTESLALLARFLGLYPPTSLPDASDIQAAMQIKQFYSQVENGFLQMTTDAYFSIPDLITTKLMSKYNPNIYNYFYNQQNTFSAWAKIYNFSASETPQHGDTHVYWFATSADADFTEDDYTTEKILNEVIAAFARNQNPTPPSGLTPVWKPIAPDSDNMAYMELNSEPMMKNKGWVEEFGYVSQIMWGPFFNETNPSTGSQILHQRMNLRPSQHKLINQGTRPSMINFQQNRQMMNLPMMFTSLTRKNQKQQHK